MPKEDQSLVDLFTVMYRFTSTCQKSLLRQPTSFYTVTSKAGIRNIACQHSIPKNAYLSRYISFASPILSNDSNKRGWVPRLKGNNNNLFSTVAATTQQSQSNQSSSSDKSSDDKSNEKKKDDSNIFLDNLGKIFLSTIALVLLSLLRSNKGNNAKAALRENIESAALLDPLEVEDLRLANDHLTREVWDEIAKKFSGQEAITYGLFMNGVLGVLRNKHGEGATIQCGHLMDRVVIRELERVAREEKVVGLSRETELPVSFLLTALSLALNSTITDRVDALYNIMRNAQGDNANEESTSEQTVSIKQVEEMVQHLQRTCQLVPDAQIIPTNSDIPYQSYRVGNGAELTQRACEGLNILDRDGENSGSGSKAVYLKDFYAILKSRSVCAWGECYVKKTDKMATSDR